MAWDPIVIQGPIEAVAQAVADVGVTALFLAILLAAVSLVLRFRRDRGQQRQQLKWLACGGASWGPTSCSTGSAWNRPIWWTR